MCVVCPSCGSPDAGMAWRSTLAEERGRASFGAAFAEPASAGLDYYEAFELPDEPKYGACGACLAHPATQQVSREEIIKLYYDYARGAGNGALLPGRTLSSFVFEPHWSKRPWPPKDKAGPIATDAELGLL